MTDEELAKIEVENQRRFEADLTCCGSYNDTAKLIAEVRRLKAENERLRNEIHRLQPPMMDGGGYDLRNMPL